MAAKFNKAAITRPSCIRNHFEIMSYLSPEKHIARVRPMNGCVAHGARLILRCLIVSGASRSLHGECVALQTQQVDLAHPQEPWVRRPMWRMTTGATLGLDGYMLIYERTLLVDVALDANCVSTGQGS